MPAPFDRVLAAYRRAAEKRLSGRAELPLPVLAAESRAVSPAAAIVLLETLGRTLGVPPGKLRANDSLESLFAVRPEEAAAPAREPRDAAGPADGEDPLSAMLLAELRRVTMRSAWERMSRTITPPPRGDGEWLNVMLGLRVDEWVRTWAPAVSPGLVRHGGGAR
ncbi:MAG TPA: hypothetical protein VGQ17_13610 [Gemmatimonadales bacterium]|jgi:hypothetical protein|nr:hypothetical protein [Gemmatimonadales bacterium]